MTHDNFYTWKLMESSMHDFLWGIERDNVKLQVVIEIADNKSDSKPAEWGGPTVGTGQASMWLVVLHIKPFLIIKTRHCSHMCRVPLCPQTATIYSPQKKISKYIKPCPDQK